MQSLGQSILSLQEVTRGNVGGVFDLGYIEVVFEAALVAQCKSLVARLPVLDRFVGCSHLGVAMVSW